MAVMTWCFSGFMSGGGCDGGAPDGCGGPRSRLWVQIALSAAKSAPALGDYAVTTPVISRPERSGRSRRPARQEDLRRADPALRSPTRRAGRAGGRAHDPAPVPYPALPVG